MWNIDKAIHSGKHILYCEILIKQYIHPFFFCWSLVIAGKSFIIITPLLCLACWRWKWCRVTLPDSSWISMDHTDVHVLYQNRRYGICILHSCIRRSISQDFFLVSRKGGGVEGRWVDESNICTSSIDAGFGKQMN